MEFRTFSQNSVLAGDKGTNMAYFCLVQAAVENYSLHDCAVKCMTATRALIEGILKILNISEILPVYLLYLSVAVIDNKCCIFGPNWSRLGGR